MQMCGAELFKQLQFTVNECQINTRLLYRLIVSVDMVLRHPYTLIKLTLCDILTPSSTLFYVNTYTVIKLTQSDTESDNPANWLIRALWLGTKVPGLKRPHCIPTPSSGIYYVIYVRPHQAITLCVIVVHSRLHCDILTPSSSLHLWYTYILIKLTFRDILTPSSSWRYMIYLHPHEAYTVLYLHNHQACTMRYTYTLFNLTQSDILIILINLTLWYTNTVIKFTLCDVLTPSWSLHSAIYVHLHEACSVILLHPREAYTVWYTYTSWSLYLWYTYTLIKLTLCDIPTPPLSLTLWYTYTLLKLILCDILTPSICLHYVFHWHPTQAYTGIP